MNPTLACGRGTVIVLQGGVDYYACLYAGALTQVGPTQPNCSRGTRIGLAAGVDYYACLYAGSLSQVGTNTSVVCGRGTAIGLQGVFNEPPETTSDVYAVDEDDVLVVNSPGVLGNDSDPEGDAMTAQLGAGVSHGFLSLNADGSFSYTPDADFNGEDSFTYRAVDAFGAASPLTTVTITVNPINDVPVAVDDSYTTDEDTALIVNAPGILDNDTDVDGDTLTAVLDTGPAHGVLALNADGSFTYTPDANYFGTDSVTYMANDGTVDSNVATVTITVVPVNDAPVANDDSYQTDEDSALVVAAVAGVLENDTDVENDPLTAVLVDDVSDGTLALNPNGSFTYTPDADFHGTDSFTYRANDGQPANNLSNTATVTITINPVNDAPVALNDSYTTDEDTLLSEAAPGVLDNDDDVDGDAITAVLVSGPSHAASFTLNADGSFTYTPDANYHGADSFTYKANDGTVDSNIATVTITVNPVNDPPVAQNDSYATDSAGALTVTAPGVLGNDNDVDGDSLTAVLVTGPTDAASFTLNPDGSFSYTANSGASVDSFTYMANDGTADSNVATVSITINAIPVADSQSVSTDEDTPLLIVLTASDADDEDLSFTIGTPPAHGGLGSITVDCSAVGTCTASVTYTPDANFNGLDSFTFTVNDGMVNSNIATVSITVNAVNDAPTASNQLVTIAEDTPTIITVSGSDIDGDALTFTIVTPPTEGTLVAQGSPSCVAGTCTMDYLYTPDPNFNGPDSFTFKVNDGALDSTADATVTITVSAVNDAPQADAQIVSTDEDTPLLITLTGSDIDMDPLAFTVTVDPLHGTLSGTMPNLTYTPDANYHGPDSFTFQVCDPEPLCDTAVISITVNEVNDAPVLANIEIADLAYIEGAPATVLTTTITVMDVDSAQLVSATVTITSGYVNGEDVLAFVNTAEITGVFAAGVLTLTGTATLAQYQAALRSVTYENLSDNPGASKTVSFQVNDGEALNNLSNTVTRDIAVTAVNDPPVITAPLSVIADEDTNLGIGGISIADVDSGAGAITVDLAVSNGTLTLTGAGGVTLVGNGTGAVEVSGALADVNGVLGSLVYLGTLNFNGSDTLTVDVTDNGNTGTGGPQTDSATVAITVTAINDAPVVPARTFDARANLTLTISDGTTQSGNLLVGVTDPDSGDSGYTAVFTASLVAGTVSPADATVTVDANGNLTVAAPAGYTGDVTFTYQVCDTGNPAPAQCATATVTVTVGGPVVWFIDDLSGSGGTGTLSNPFRTIAEFNAATTGDNQYIFVFDGATSYTGSMTLRSGQQLWGRGAFGSGALTQIPGITAPPAGSEAYPTFNGTRPTLTNGGAATAHTLTLHNDNIVRGLNLTSATNTFAALGASSKGGTTNVQDVIITGSGGGSGIDLQTQTGTLNLTNVQVSVTGGAGTALRLNLGSAVITFDANSSITQSGTGRAIHITGRTTGNVTFNGTVTATSANNQGVLLATNGTSVINFTNTIQIANSVTDMFTATGSGTVIATNAANTLSASNLIALRVENVTIGAGGLVFRSISANGGTNGIVLTNTGSTAGLTVTGNAGACSIATPTCTGGTIQNTTNAGVALTNTLNVSLTRMRITGAGFHGISGSGVNGLSLFSSYLHANGNGDDENGLNLVNSSGTLLLDGTMFNGAHEDLVRVNSSGSMTITAQNGTHFEYPNPHGGGDPGNAIALTPTGAASFTVSIENITFKNIRAMSLHFGPDATATGAHSVTFSDNTVSVDAALNQKCSVTPQCRAGGISVTSGTGAGQTTLFVEDNVFDRASGGSVIVVGGSGTSTMRATIQNNNISNALAHGITVGQNVNSRMYVLVNNNTMSNLGANGIEVEAGEDTNAFTGDLDIVITNNTINNHSLDSSVAWVGGIGMFRFGGPGQDVCVALTGNTVIGTNFPSYYDVYIEGDFMGLGGTITYEGAGMGPVDAARIKLDNPGVTQLNVMVGSTTLSNGATCQRP